MVKHPLRTYTVWKLRVRDGLTFREIAEKYGFSNQRARQLFERFNRHLMWGNDDVLHPGTFRAHYRGFKINQKA